MGLTAEPLFLPQGFLGGKVAEFRSYFPNGEHLQPQLNRDLSVTNERSPKCSTREQMQIYTLRGGNVECSLSSSREKQQQQQVPATFRPQLERHTVFHSAASPNPPPLTPTHARVHTHNLNLIRLSIKESLTISLSQSESQSLANEMNECISANS